MSFAMNTFNSNFDPFSIQFPRLDQLLDMELRLIYWRKSLTNQFHDKLSMAKTIVNQNKEKKIEKINGKILDQKGAQIGHEQVEIRRGNLIQITLEPMSGYVGVAVFYTNPIYRQNTIMSQDNLCPFSLNGPG